MVWDPLRDLRTWQDRLEQLSSPHPDSWSPAIDVYETADAYILAAEVPGLGREDVQLSIDDNRLMLRGERRDRQSGEILHFHQIERGHGAFSRTFTFAEKIDVQRVSADLAQGVLTVTLPKAPPPPARKIDVK